MCIAIVKPAGKWVSKEHLRNSFEGNPHGAGYAWHDGVKVQIRKGFFTWRSFWRAYKRDVSANVAAFAHFRIATRGTKNEANCHPFQMDKAVLMHNGPCLNHRYCNGDKEGDRSDSWQFADDFISGLSSTQVKRLQPMIEDFSGSEKVIMMFDDGEIVICNEREGTWSAGCWFSNSSFHGYGKRTSHKIGLPTTSMYDLAAEDAWYENAYNRSSTYDDSSWINKQIAKRFSDATEKSMIAPVVVRPIAKIVEGKNYAQCVYSEKLKEYLPKHVLMENQNRTWSEEWLAYLDDSLPLSDQAMASNSYIYDYDVDGDFELVAEVLSNAGALRVYLDDCDVPESTVSVTTTDSRTAVH